MATSLEDVPAYTVVKGDNLWNIAKKHKISLDELRKMNPNLKGDLIYPGDKLALDYKYNTKQVDITKEQFFEDSLPDDVSVIHSAPHNSNYAIVNKADGVLTVFDRKGKELYSTKITTGKAGTDYNTVTYTKNGSIVNYAGNNSTPAGVTVITGKGTYHGVPSFTRGRINSEGKPEDIASSIHFRNTTEKHTSNGCIGVSGEDLTTLSNFLGIGDYIYTLPEQKGSKFSLKGGKLQYTASNPYGTYMPRVNPNASEETQMKQYEEVYAKMQEFKNKYGDNWEEEYNKAVKLAREDDYNVHIDKSYSPLAITPKNSIQRNEYDILGKVHDAGAQIYANTISTNKEKIQKRLNLTSDTFNRLAQLAMGIGEQESKFGSSLRYFGKQAFRAARNDFDYNVLANAKNIITGKMGIDKLFKQRYISEGITQIKMAGDNAEMQELYKEFGITPEVLQTPQGAAIATLLRLGYIYNSEVKGRKYKGPKGLIDPFDMLLYKYNGKHKELARGTATPDKNEYIQNVKRYSKNFNYYETRKYRE